MGEQNLNIRIKHKYDTEANWNKNNPVLLSGEIAITSDKFGKHKVGDGTHKWSELSYAKAELTKGDVTGALGYTPPSSDTWRGIQDNLISSSTTESLSAAQGKILKELVDGKAPSSHTHTKSEVGLGNVDNTADATKSVKYATSAGSASSAAALTSNAGSSTQPVYFSGGKPVACSYTLGKSVPADALFTDHTYGNMKGATSSSAGSAGLVPAPNIGEQLKFLRADGAWVIPTNTTYSVGTSSYLGITKLYTETGSATDGTMTQNAITSALNGKSPTSHTHNYAGSSSSGGAANSANKLATARTVSGGTDITLSFNYDGSGNSSANIGFYSSSASVGDKNNYPFHRFAKLDTIAASYSDKSTTFFISQDYSGGGFGIVRIVLRTNNSSLASTVEVKWLVRCGLSADSVQVGIYNVFGKTYADAFFKTGGSYAGTCFRTLASGARGGISRTWVLVNSSEVSGTSATDAKTSTECYATIAAAGTALHKQAYSSIVSGTDSGTASYANSAGSASNVKDSGDSKSITFAYSKAGLNYGEYTWIAAWNGGELRAINKNQFATAGHTHHYAGSSSAGGSATSAVKLDTSTAGSATQPVYFTGGKPVACTYTLGKSVPSNAVFTDTNNKMTQTAIASKDYTNWRTILWGASNSGTEGFTPTTVTDGAFTDTNLSYQPSTGTLRAKVFKGDLYQTTTIGNSTATECSLNFLSNAKLSDGSYLAQNYRIVNDRKTDFVFGIKTKNNEWASYCQGTQVYFKNSSADISALAGKMLPPVLTDFSGSKDSPGAGTGRVLSIASNVDSKIIKFRIFTSSTATTATTVNVTYSTSDIRLKDNVKDTDIKDALSVINKMKIRQFDWKDDNKHQKIGFVADELEELDDKLVVGGGWEDEEHTQMNVKGVDTFYMMGYVVKGMQELSEQIKALTEENKELKKQIEGLKREG